MSFSSLQIDTEFVEVLAFRLEVGKNSKDLKSLNVYYMYIRT